MSRTKGYWELERADFAAAKIAAGQKGYTYRDWQPTKWQSLDRLRREVLACAVAHKAPIHSAIELGCGSATLLLQLAIAGVRGVGIDRDRAALRLATDAAQSHDVTSDVLTFAQEDFMTRPPLARADLVFSIGVIEHFDASGQRAVLRRHCAASDGWVLLAVPNCNSPLFQAFLRAKAADGRLYEDEHQAIDVPLLAHEAGMEVVLDDGCHVFLSKQDDGRFADDRLTDFESLLRNRLVAMDARYGSYPHLDLTADDIDFLSKVEEDLPRALRQDFGFLRWYLLRLPPALRTPEISP